MMGNWSLGDYFKKESLTRSIEFLTQKCGIPLEKLGATIFVGEGNVPKDLEAKQTLLNL
jgi:alanyl-tRNA synthetase